jgi:hypothetical protein
MKHTGRFHYDPVKANRTKGPAFKIKVSRLKDLSDRKILFLMRDIVSQIERDRLFLTESQMKGLRKRLQDLAGEMADRIEYYEYLASIDESLPEVEALRLTDENPPRKALGKVYVKGIRLKAGPKRDYRRSRRRLL